MKRIMLNMCILIASVSAQAGEQVVTVSPSADTAVLIGLLATLASKDAHSQPGNWADITGIVQGYSEEPVAQAVAPVVAVPEKKKQSLVSRFISWLGLDGDGLDVRDIRNVNPYVPAYQDIEYNQGQNVFEDTKF